METKRTYNTVQTILAKGRKKMRKQHNAGDYEGSLHTLSETMHHPDVEAFLQEHGLADEVLGAIDDKPEESTNA